jgi:ATP-dependent DNA helicase PIF1
VFKGGKFEREQIGKYVQVPLRLAWAITVHKSQGKTFDKVIIDFGRGTFAHGQSYVALSRCTSLEGMVLKRRVYRSTIIMDEQVREFHERAKSK